MNEYTDVKASFFLKLFHRSAGGFDTALWEAFSKADCYNQIKLKRGFPVYYKVYNDWYNSPNEREFFKEFLENEQKG